MADFNASWRPMGGSSGGGRRNGACSTEWGMDNDQEMADGEKPTESGGQLTEEAD